MRRKIVLVCLIFSGLAYGQTLSGSWSARLSLLPPPVALDSELTLKGKLFDWTVGGTAEYFGTDGWVWQTFFAEGGLGPVTSNWTVLFGPLAPAFLYVYGQYALMISGMDLVLHTALVGPTVPPYTFTGGPSGGSVLELKSTLNGLKLSTEIGFGARKQDFTIVYSGVGTYKKTFPIDPFPGGLTFTYLKLGAAGIPLCCGITYDADFSFTKAGFDSLKFTMKTIPLCCGISWDVGITLTTTAKSVEVKPRWAGIEGCLAVYGDAKYVGNVWDGIELYGFKVRCDLGECNYLEVLTAFNVAKIEEILGEDIFQGPEFQYLKLGFCGPGCCGGKYTVELTAYFQPMGSLFGLRRIQAEAGVPLLANFTLQMALGVTVGGPANLALGWMFTF